MKVFFRRIHLYLALAAGLVFFVQCLTGTVLVFEEEITHALHPERYSVTVPAGAARLSLTQLTAAFRQTHPQDKLLGFKVYADPARTVELSYRDSKARPEGRGGPGGAGPGSERAPRESGDRPERAPGSERGPRAEGSDRAGRGSQAEGGARGDRAERGNRSEGARQGEGAPGGERGPGRGPGGGERGKGRPERGSTAFLNPYTGQITATLGGRERTIFSVSEDLHRRLLAGEVGKALTGISAIFILFITATGLILWWPKTRDMLIGRLRVKWSGSWKRINHDLHIAMGFYCSLFLFVLTLTGIVMSYRWATEGLFWLTNSRPTVGLTAPVSAVASEAEDVAYDAALQTGQRTYQGAEFWRVGTPKDAAAAVPVSAPSSLPLRHNGLDTLFVDRTTGAALGQHLYGRQAAGAQLRRLAKPLHTGEIGGLWTKILVFVVALASLTFPVTGVILWLNRTRKKKRKSRRPMAVK